MIVVTGGAGFIGSVLLWRLNEIRPLAEGVADYVENYLATDDPYL